MTAALLDRVNPLTIASDILKVDGWTVGDFKCDDTGARCAVGAVRAVLFKKPEDDLSIKALVRNREYRESIFALADVIQPSWRSEFEERADDHGPGCTRSYCDLRDTMTNRLAYAEEIIFSYNDSRVRSKAGRDAVLRRFKKAAALLDERAEA